MFVMHIRPHPAKTLVVCLLHSMIYTTVKLCKRYSHQAENAEHDKWVTHKRFDTLMDGFVVVMLHIFVLMFYEYYNNKTLAFCQFNVMPI